MLWDKGWKGTGTVSGCRDYTFKDRGQEKALWKVTCKHRAEEVREES